jgi:intracellular septation protein A
VFTIGLWRWCGPIWARHVRFSLSGGGPSHREVDNRSMSADRFSRIILISGFAIWVVYGFLAGMGHWPAGIAFGLVASVCVLALEASRRIKVKLLDWVLLTYFVIATIATFLVRSTAFPVYSSVVVWTLYAGVTWVSILVGTPFTLQYARESAPPEHWQSPGFLRANLVISVFWGAAFLANLVLVTIALWPRYKSIWIAVAAPLLMMATATIFTSRYTKIAQQRAQQAVAAR